MRAQQQLDDAHNALADSVAALARLLADQFDGRDVASIRRDDPSTHKARKLVQRIRIKFDDLIAAIPASAGGTRGAA